MVEIANTVFDKKGYAKSFFKTKHTKYFIFNDDDIFTISTYNNRVGALGMSAPSHFLDFSTLKIENNYLVFDDKFILNDFIIYNPKIDKINFHESYDKIKNRLKDKLDYRIYNKIIDYLRISDFITLIGFGPGLTPLFDDILSGILLLNYFYNKDLDYNAILKAAKTKTNNLSYFQMKYAANGYVPKPVKLYLENFDKAALLNMGNTSGLGWMLGISFFFDLEG
ncbi:Protein of unknown function [Marinitoga hydrogenitolerans DSM 16785]|uniref:DUF2877 domain-containing protein n=1 Tax=Marinitoga hydrogenitolerans (strain DSM 16785 / JCM 12826 / AT1271) TaxID=1122195 RepID=A0A1M4SA69_MARH1|nr:DUF2877 domain-containing protein [Marinitoga hydrogenitolerans]SHE29045.1 Protein of unknown function [Marinitoga hydrogenitolerans DSM 16785]